MKIKVKYKDIKVIVNDCSNETQIRYTDHKENIINVLDKVFNDIKELTQQDR